MTAVTDRPGTARAGGDVVVARPRKRRRRVLPNVVGVLVIVVMAFPVYWMVITAFKPGRDILTETPQFLPRHPTLDNFTDAVSRPYFWSSVRNSLIVVVATVVIALFVGLPRRWACPGRGFAASRRTS